jgi:hypothetical protein
MNEIWLGVCSGCCGRFNDIESLHITTWKNSSNETTTTLGVKMYTLDAVDSFRISEPADTYIYDIVPVAAGLAAISSDDSLRLLDPLALNGPTLNSVRRVNTDVTCLKAVNTSTGGDALIVCTAGRDGRVSLIDPRSGAKVGEVRTGELELFMPFYPEQSFCLSSRFSTPIRLSFKVHLFTSSYEATRV